LRISGERGGGSQAFLSHDNLNSILNDGAVLAILGSGLTVVLIVGEFDLSIAAAAAFGGALAAVLGTDLSWPVLPIVLAVVASGILIGMVNGSLITHFEIPPRSACQACSTA
jgi:ribose transport system permease protein